MPCFDPQSDDDAKWNSQQVNKLTDLLCSACASLERNFPEAFYVNKNLGQWWKQHKLHDAHVKYAKAQYELGGDASLTPEQRMILRKAGELKL